jgi:hypothetical protein
MSAFLGDGASARGGSRKSSALADGASRPVVRTSAVVRAMEKPRRGHQHAGVFRDFARHSAVRAASHKRARCLVTVCRGEATSARAFDERYGMRLPTAVRRAQRLHPALGLLRPWLIASAFLSVFLAKPPSAQAYA